MAAIYITGITIAMLNITGIFFVIFMIIFIPQSDNGLKKANFKKSTTIMDTIEGKTDERSVSEKKVGNGVVHKKDKTDQTAVIASGAAAAGAAGAEVVNSDIKQNGNFENIDDILDELDLSDFDDLDLDDFS